MPDEKTVRNPMNPNGPSPAHLLEDADGAAACVIRGVEEIAFI